MRWYRSLVFWAGVIVMGSIMWAWRDSTRHTALMGTTDYGVISGGSGLTVTRWDVSGIGSGPMFEYRALAGDTEGLREVGLRWPVYLRNSGPEWQERMMRRFLLPDEGKGDPLGPLLLHAVMGGAGFWALYVPYWLVALVAGVLWGGLLVWRWRKGMGKMKG